MLAGTVRRVLCNDQDRLVRDMRELEDVVDAAEAGDVLLTSVNGDIDLRTDDGRMLARIKAAVARSEIEKISRRIKRQQFAASTVWCEGSRPPPHLPTFARVRALHGGDGPHRRATRRRLTGSSGPRGAAPISESGANGADCCTLPFELWRAPTGEKRECKAAVNGLRVRDVGRAP
jgi:hypothetical protein